MITTLILKTVHLLGDNIRRLSDGADKELRRLQ